MEDRPDDEQFESVTDSLNVPMNNTPGEARTTEKAKRLLELHHRPRIIALPKFGARFLEMHGSLE
jgi:hypothetical protein